MSIPPEHAASPVDEQLSAWLDDELPPAELELLAARVAGSPELSARAARYGLIGAALRGGSPGEGSADLLALRVAGRVRAALDAETAAPVPVAPSRRGAIAAAAGVALLAVTLVPLLGTRPGPAPGVTVSAMAPAATPVALAPQSSLSPRRLTSYLVYHGEYSGTLSAKLTDSHIVNNRAYVVPVRTDTGTAGQ